MNIVRLTMFLFTFSMVECYSQTTEPLSEDNFYNIGVSGNYYKDLDNEMDYFLGTWIHDDGDNQFTLFIKKEERVPFNGSFKDMLVGEYRFVQNGIEKVNSLNLLDTRSGRAHLIHGNSIVYNCWYLNAKNCRDGEPRFVLRIDIPNVDRPLGTISLHKPAVNRSLGQELLIGEMVFEFLGHLQIGESLPEIDLPWQEDYLFVRQ
ncbi:DUF6705 family protein [Nonlabens ponticola]|uniref:DUF6705 domain-containing protein n=1 Tax=Nonlabens ponticola TaxID=2496866 RepID=A0A3S9MUT3_9FLAO|nr:DUF6705 family protein [Nonlabens ponticola]AZQ42932.1 hypothetical protein EJ995_01285 [Nonlabens ponticola]